MMIEVITIIIKATAPLPPSAVKLQLCSSSIVKKLKSSYYYPELTWRRNFMASSWIREAAITKSNKCPLVCQSPFSLALAPVLTPSQALAAIATVSRQELIGAETAAPVASRASIQLAS